jgi:hypothetical protein
MQILVRGDTSCARLADEGIEFGQQMAEGLEAAYALGGEEAAITAGPGVQACREMALRPTTGETRGAPLHQPSGSNQISKKVFH